ncbi:hypothetical protein [Micromonospora tulbaghiae]|uniref:hypothetical protein n=1 Tax=Micromonospora tulbaghiae TaxID=479978 RepID=UPI0013C4F35B|nr:hypothetical protein [Micromonospora tulbaghiae]
MWVAGKTAGELTPSPRSIIDGSEAASVVDTSCLGRYGLSRFVVSLSVDAATAKRFTRTCRMETIWRRKVVPAVLVVTALIVLAHVVDSVRNDAQHTGVTLLITLILAFTVLAGRLALNLLHSRHHPKEVRGNVYIRGVDGETVKVWTSLNPTGAIKIIGG